MLPELHALLTANRVSPAQAGVIWRDTPGIYALFVDTPSSLPEPYAGVLRERGTDLIYIGLASKSLRSRGFEQELRHKSPATFFRSLGAALGYRPAAGSLVGMKNQNNYKFPSATTEQIIAWIDAHLTAAAVEMPAETIAAHEKAIIEEACPLLNLQNNPKRLAPLEAARAHCCSIARGNVTP